MIKHARHVGLERGNAVRGWGNSGLAVLEVFRSSLGDHWMLLYLPGTNLVAEAKPLAATGLATWSAAQHHQGLPDSGGMRVGAVMH